MTIDGNTLIAWGFKPGRWFNDAINDGNALLKQGWSEEAVREIIAERQPAEIQPRTNALPFNVFLDPETDDEAENLAGVVQHMDVLMRVPVVTAGAVMPDACTRPTSAARWRSRSSGAIWIRPACSTSP